MNDDKVELITPQVGESSASTPINDFESGSHHSGPPVDLGKTDQPSEEPELISRMGFIKVAVGGMCLAYAAAVGYPIFRYLNSPVERETALAAVKDVALAGADKLPMGGVLLFKFGPFPSMLIHHLDGSWVAFDAVCSHLGCTVQYHPDQDKIVCACHGGVYDAHTGGNISGPPPKPLQKFVVKVGTGSVTVSRA